MPEEADVLRYALAMQLATAHAVESNYGAFLLDIEMRTAVERVLRPIILRRLKRLEKVEGNSKI